MKKPDASGTICNRVLKKLRTMLLCYIVTHIDTTINDLAETVHGRVIVLQHKFGHLSETFFSYSARSPLIR